MIGRTNVGGGDGLNFKVVGGTTKPSNPKENTIWVNTNTEITSWDFSAAQPNRRSKNKNLLVYPFNQGSFAYYGITATDNGDGTVKLDGTCTNTYRYQITARTIAENNRSLRLPTGTYFLSGCPSGASSTTFCLGIEYSYDNWATSMYLDDYGDGAVLNLEHSADLYVYCYVRPGTVLTNAVFKPQLEKGSAATSFVKGDATGQVWFATGETSNAVFNALKKNNITVYPISAKQYVNGAWAIKTAQSYLGGAWKSWTTYLFNLGDKCTAVTGGWQTQAVGRGAVSAGNQEAEAPILASQSNGGVKLHMDYGCGIYRTVNKINLSGVNTITFNGTIKERTGNDNWMGIYVWSSIGTYYVDNVAAKLTVKGTTKTGDITLDVGSLTGSYYIGLALHENTVDSSSGYIIMNSLRIS